VAGARADQDRSQAPLTGAAATDGVSAKIAAETARDKINAAGGVLGQKIELVTYDDQAKTEEAVFTANKPSARMA
jgi:branched-chain amino acid transport system substrate-binding protein